MFLTHPKEFDGLVLRESPQFGVAGDEDGILFPGRFRGKSICRQFLSFEGLVVAPSARSGRSGPHVIPAKAGIQYVRRSAPKVWGVDSRLRGNDVWSGTHALFN